MKYAVGKLEQDMISGDKHVSWIRYNNAIGYYRLWTTNQSERIWFTKATAAHLAAVAGDFIISEDGDYESAKRYNEAPERMYVTGLTLLKMQSPEGANHLTEEHEEALTNIWALISYTVSQDYWMGRVIAQRNNLTALIDRYGDYPIANREVERSPIASYCSVLVNQSPAPKPFTRPVYWGKRYHNAT